MPKFEANISKVLHLLSHSIYTNKDTFIREITSNSFDACEKLKYLSLSQENLSKYKDRNYKIEIEIDKIANTIIFRDNGIGLTAEEMSTHLGTIASSGTEAFLKNLSESKEKADLIGQFGIGFYSAFVVADKVQVISNSARLDIEEWNLWASDGIEEFSIEKLNQKDGLQNFNTEVKIYLKEEFKEDYLDRFKVENIIKTYLSHISIPIQLIYEGSNYNIIQDSKALWLKNKSEVSQEEYKNFYQSISHSPDEPCEIIHKQIEGKVNFSSLIFIPSVRPFDIYHPDRITRVKLYIRKVLISESLDVLPKYLRFIIGVVGSDDLPLNVSRESVQNDVKIRFIKDKLTNDILKILKKISDEKKEKYNKFWENFGPVLKEGLCEGFANREDLLFLARFRTTKSEDLTSFDDYISRMKEGQKSIFYITGEKHEEIKYSSYLEIFKKKDIEVILFSDAVDSFWLNLIADVKGKDLKCVTSSDLEINEDIKKEENKAENQKIDNLFHKSIIEKFSKILEGKVSKVIISSKLIDSPVCISKSIGTMDPIMEKILIEQKQKDKISLRTLEINADSIIITRAIELLNSDSEDKIKQGEELVLTLFDLGNINFGTEPDNRSLFVKRVFDLIK